MNSALEVLADRLPKVWPTKANMPAEWWAEHGGKIKVEDTLMQVLCDLLLGRDPAKTGSAPAVVRLQKLKAKSQNQKKLRAVGILIRDDNPVPLLAILRDEQRNGICYLEQFARYQPRFHTTAAVAALIYLRLHGTPTQDHRDLWVALIAWLGQERWCLERFEWPEKSGGIYWIGLRRSGNGLPLDRIQLGELRGEGVDLTDRETRRDLGLETAFPSGPYMNGGPPVAMSELLLLAAGKLGLLEGGIKAVMPPKLAIPISPRRADAGGMMDWFPRLHWWPGDGPILVASEIRRGEKRPTLWVLFDKHTAIPKDRGNDTYLTKIPGEHWGFDPGKREVVVLG